LRNISNPAILRATLSVMKGTRRQAT
jgi:hypothetical protein